MAVWNDLPAEVRLKIYEHRYNLGGSPPKSKCLNSGQKRNHRLSTCAAVSREWQEFYESRLFSKLIICQSDLKKFTKLLVPHRRYWLRTLWLRVEIQSGACYPCNGRESTRRSSENNLIFTTAIWKLFLALKFWEIEEQTSPDKLSLTLCFSAYTPGYESHSNNFYHSGSSHPIYHCDHPSPLQCPFHTSVDTLNTDSRLQMFGTNPPRLDLRLIRMHPLHNLPELNFVTGFVITRQLCGRIPTLGLIARRFPNLQHVSCEQWRRLGSNRDAYALLQQVIGSLPFKLHRFSAYLDSSVITHSNQQRISVGESDPAAALRLRMASHQFKEIDVSYFIDAEWFFAPFMFGSTPDQYWPNLERFSMTSHMLSSDWQASCDPVLQGAARAALHMPKLRRLQIWYGYDEELCIFRYVKRAQDSVIEWLRTSNARQGPSQAAIQAWRSTAEVIRTNPIHVRQTEVPILEAKYNRSVHPPIAGASRTQL